jgi:hypothetical protein
MKKDILSALFGVFGMTAKDKLILKRDDKVSILSEKIVPYGGSGKSQGLLEISVNGNKPSLYSVSAVLESLGTVDPKNVKVKEGYIPSDMIRKTFQRCFYKAK